MTTTVLHADVQRSRFVQHLLATLSGLAFWLTSAPRRKASPVESAALEAQKVRDLAYSYAKTDPGFAADLYAAAARHEGLGEV
ncbi:MAG: hypothetical protein ABI702_16055 [Burkholderiales bacterium]